MIDYVSKQDKMLRSREGTILPCPVFSSAKDLKYNKLNKQ